MERYIAVAKENWKHNMPISLLVCTLLLLGSPLVVGIENLTEPEVAKVTEYYLVFLGIILFPPVFLAEQNRDIRELVMSKYTPVAAVYSVRIVQAILSLMIFTGIYLGVMRAGNCDFPFGKIYAGTLAGMLFLGGMGVLIYGLTDQIVIGYMVPFLYYMLNVSAGYQKMGVFYLFSMCVGKYEVKGWFEAAGVMMMAAGIYLRTKRK